MLALMIAASDDEAVKIPLLVLELIADWLVAIAEASDDEAVSIAAKTAPLLPAAIMSPIEEDEVRMTELSIA